MPVGQVNLLLILQNIVLNFSTPSAWSLFASAFVSDTTVRDNLIRSVYNHANSNQSVGVLPERYSVTSNAMDNGRAR